MKSKCRVWIAMILFAAASTAVVSAQNQDNPTPPPAQEATPALPPAPSAQNNQAATPVATVPASAPQPTLSASPRPTPLVAPTIAAETKSSKSAARKDSVARKGNTAKNTEPASPSQAESKDKDKAAAAAGAAIVDTNANPPGSSPPSAPADNTDTALKPSSLANTSAADSAAPSENDATKGAVRQRGMGVGAWALLGILALFALGAIARAVASNGREDHLSILEHEPTSTGHP